MFHLNLMIRKSGIQYLYSCLFLLIVIFGGCEKPKGDIYLRIYNTIDSAQDVVVKDLKGEVPIDGQYHKVSRYSQTSYILPDVIYDSIIGQLPSVYWPRIIIMDINIQISFGDFEILEDDSYYTLTLDYIREVTGPEPYLDIVFDDIYEMKYRYYDNSKLVRSSGP